MDTKNNLRSAASTRFSRYLDAVNFCRYNLVSPVHIQRTGHGLNRKWHINMEQSQWDTMKNALSSSVYPSLSVRERRRAEDFLFS